MMMGNNTTVTQRAGMTCVTLYSTDVVAFNDATIRLCTGGHVTAVTAKRMQQASEAFGLGFTAKRKDGEVHIVYKGVKYTFTSELVLKR